LICRASWRSNTNFFLSRIEYPGSRDGVIHPPG
jgi:hypothetical protein